MNEEMKINCCVCGEEFLPDDDFTFVCKDCTGKLVCSCGSDDVVMDWQIEDVVFMYRWEIECRECNKSMKSPAFDVEGFDNASSLFDKWMEEVGHMTEKKG